MTLEATSSKHHHHLIIRQVESGRKPLDEFRVGVLEVLEELVSVVQRPRLGGTIRAASPRFATRSDSIMRLYFASSVSCSCFDTAGGGLDHDNDAFTLVTSASSFSMRSNIMSANLCSAVALAASNNSGGSMDCHEGGCDTPMLPASRRVCFIFACVWA